MGPEMSRGFIHASQQGARDLTKNCLLTHCSRHPLLTPLRSLIAPRHPTLLVILSAAARGNLSNCTAELLTSCLELSKRDPPGQLRKRTGRTGDGEMAHQVGTRVLLQRTGVWFPQLTSSNAHLPGATVPGNLMLYSDSQGHLHTCGTHKLIRLG